MTEQIHGSSAARIPTENKAESAAHTPHEEAVALLAKWDAGEIVWTVEMGGMGPGYEQALQNAAFEVLRIMVEQRFDTARWSDATAWQADRDIIEKVALPRLEGEGLSGAQWGAAVNIASCFYAQGHEAGRKAAGDDRAIMVEKAPPRRVIGAAPEMARDGAFLLERLAEFEQTAESESGDAAIRDWHGHVVPAIARFRAAIAKATGAAQ